MQNHKQEPEKIVVVTRCVITVKFLTKHKETGCKPCALRGLSTLLLQKSNKNMSIRRKIRTVAQRALRP
jgi:hypothetical protein